MWDISVDEDASFTAEGCVVKNCPLQFDIVERCIEQYSMKDETVFDPFGGLMTVPYCAVRMGRRGRGHELGPGYFRDGVDYVRAAEAQAAVPTLFDLVAAQTEASADNDVPEGIEGVEGVEGVEGEAAPAAEPTAPTTAKARRRKKGEAA